MVYQFKKELDKYIAKHNKIIAGIIAVIDCKYQITLMQNVVLKFGQCLIRDF